MQMKTHSIVYFLVFTCFLVVGYTFSIRFYHPSGALSGNSVRIVTAEGRNPITTLDNGQRSILLVGADDLNAVNPRLQSIWLATYLPDDTAIQLFPVFPSAKGSASDFEKQLGQSFKINGEARSSGLDQAFTRLLEENNYWWSGYIIFDEISLAKTLGLLGAVGVSHSSLSGEQVIQKLTMAVTSSAGSLTSQVTLLRAICHSLAQVNSASNLPALARLFPSHFITDLDANTLQSELVALVSGRHTMACRFPTMELSRIEP